MLDTPPTLWYHWCLSDAEPAGAGRYSKEEATLTNDLKWMLSSDQQIPFQCDKCIKIWFDVMGYVKPDVVDYLGDTSDQFCFSNFGIGRREEFLSYAPKVDVYSGANPDDFDAEEFANRHLMKMVVGEEAKTAEFYAKTRKKRPNAEIFSALGNHDIRVWNYADKYMKEIYDRITPESLWGLDNLGIDYIFYEDKPRLRYGGFYVHHGISALAEAGASVKSDIDKLGVSLIRGHSHRMGSYYKTYELRNETLRGYEIGHMCAVDSEGFKYTQIHNWQKGFAIGTISGDNAYIQLVEILPDHTCVVNGKKFSA